MRYERSGSVSKKRYFRMRKRRKRIEAWPRIRPCVKVGWRVKTYADAMGVGEAAEEKMEWSKWRI